MEKWIKILTWAGLIGSAVTGFAGGAAAVCKMRQLAEQNNVNSDTNMNVEA